MLGVSRLLNGTVRPEDALRYGRQSSRGPAHLLHYSADKKPVIVWNITRRCTSLVRLADRYQADEGH